MTSNLLNIDVIPKLTLAGRRHGKHVTFTDRVRPSLGVVLERLVGGNWKKVVELKPSRRGAVSRKQPPPRGKTKWRLFYQKTLAYSSSANSTVTR